MPSVLYIIANWMSEAAQDRHVPANTPTGIVGGAEIDAEQPLAGPGPG
jgi:hypothetical protein